MDIQTGAAILKLVTLDLLKKEDPSTQAKWAWSKQLKEMTKLFQEVVPDLAADANNPGALADKVGEHDFSEEESVRLTIEHLNWPLSHKDSDQDLIEAAKLDVLGLLGLDDELSGYFSNLKQSAEKAHRKVNWLKAGAIGLGGAAVLALGGWMAAPLIGGAVGAAMGLSGAAATSAGLALLGGGSLAAGGAGMAGGVLLMTAVGTAAGVGLGGAIGAGVSKDVPPAQYRFAVVTQQMLSLAMFEVLEDEETAEQAIELLVKQAELMQAELQKEEAKPGYSEERDKQIKELKLKLQANRDGLQWIREHLTS